MSPSNPNACIFQGSTSQQTEYKVAVSRFMLLTETSATYLQQDTFHTGGFSPDNSHVISMRSPDRCGGKKIVFCVGVKGVKKRKR